MMRFLMMLVCLVGPSFGQFDSVEDLLEKFRTGKDQLHAIGYMSRVATPDPRILAGLVDLFDRTDDPQVRWQIAGAMLEKHDPNPRYVSVLSNAMLSVIEANPPDDASFTAWCSELSLPLPIKECEKKYGSLTLTFLFMPAHMSKDPRFIPIFRKGISARMHLIWEFSSGGLMMLGDKESIPAVARRIARDFSNDPVQISRLLNFDDPRADLITFELAKSDPKTLDMLRKRLIERPELMKKLADGK